MSRSVLARFFSSSISALALMATMPGLHAAEGAPGDPVAFAAMDTNFRYEGRFDVSDPHGPVFIWQSSRVQFDFEGDAPVFIIQNLQGESHFDLDVDGRTVVMSAKGEGEKRLVCPFSLGPGRHRISLAKRSEASAGWARFVGIEAPKGARVFSSPVPNYRTNMLFLGDSITAGACDEDAGPDQWEDRSTHNSEKAYPAETAAAFSADFRNISISGMGISIGYVEIRAGDAWDRLYPRTGGVRAEVAAWTPSVVFMNFGENDGSFTRSREMEFPRDFAERYMALVRTLRDNYPSAQIVLLRGGMWNGANNEALRIAWQRAVTTLTAEDQKVASFVFKQWSQAHPRVSEQHAMAAELIDWLRQQPFMTRD